MNTDSGLPPQEIPPLKRAKKEVNWLRRSLILVIVGVLALLCLNGLIYYILVQTKDEIASVVSVVSKRAAAGDRALAINQIAFVGNDNNVWLVSPDGEKLQSLTQDADGRSGYRFPTWAPDGRHIAFVGSRPDSNSALFIVATDEAAPTVLYDAPDSAPFYLYWSPDSEAITFLTQELSGLSMRQVSVPDLGDSRVIEEGAPFYWVWAPEGDRLLMHVGGARSLSKDAHLSVVDNQEDAARIELKLAPGSFQAPIWSSDGKYAFYVAENDAGHDTIFRMDMETLEQQQLTELAGVGRTYMVISPDSQHIAYLEAGIDRPIPLGTPYLIDINGQAERPITNRTVMSMYWSPDGTKLVLLTAGFDDDEPSVKTDGLAAPTPQQVVFRWWVYDLESESLEALLNIRPTIDFLQTVPYFDQYHLSLTFWSPDSRYFVVSTEVSANRDGAIMILDTSGQEEPRQVGDGTLAVWSWK